MSAHTLDLMLPACLALSAGMVLGVLALVLRDATTARRPRLDVEQLTRAATASGWTVTRTRYGVSVHRTHPAHDQDEDRGATSTSGAAPLPVPVLVRAGSTS